MPSTMPGFLLLAGMALILFALLAKNIRIKEVPIAPKALVRFIIGVIGLVSLLFSGVVYYKIYSGELELMDVKLLAE